MSERKIAHLRTRVANQAASLAETINEGFASLKMGQGAYGVDLSTPEGQSTGGGAQARQQLRLVPKREGFSAVMAGVVDPVAAVAEMRTYEHVAAAHEIRFRRPLDIAPEEYAEFLKRLNALLGLCRLKAVYVPPPPELLAERDAMRLAEQTKQRSLSTPAVVGLAAAFVVALLIVGVVVYKVVLAK